MNERAVQFGRFKSLVGVLTEPDTLAAAARPAVILANAGMIHHIGPNRIYVKLARALASQGFTVLRFDISGIGDSAPRPDHMPVEQFTVDDMTQAMDFLAETTGSRRFVVGGHCAGGYHGFRVAAQDARAVGVVMINPDSGEAEWAEYDKKRKLAQYYQNYYGKKALFDPQRWKRLFTGQANYRALAGSLFRNIIANRVSALWFRLRRRFVKARPTEADQKLFTVESFLRKMPELDVQLLMVYSENATSLERLRGNAGKELQSLQSSGRMQLKIIPGADHIFSPVASQDCLFEIIGDWMREQYG